MIVVLAGAPGAGKGTHATRVGEKLGVPNVSTGDVLRNAVAAGTELGRKAEGYMKAGELVPDGIMLSLVAERLDSPEWSRGVVLDGFPRTLAQAKGFAELLSERGRAVDGVIFFDIDEDASVRRLSARLWCPRDGSVYNTETKPPTSDERCDVCGGPLERRSDDRPETIRARHEEFRRTTGPMIEYYERQGILRRVDGEGSIEDVRDDVESVLDGLRARIGERR